MACDFSLKCSFLKFPAQFCARTRPGLGTGLPEPRTHLCAQLTACDSGQWPQTLKRSGDAGSHHTRPATGRSHTAPSFSRGSRTLTTVLGQKASAARTARTHACLVGCAPVSVAGPPEDARTKSHRLRANWLVSKGVTMRAHCPFQNPKPSRSNFQITHIVHLY